MNDQRWIINKKTLEVTGPFTMAYIDKNVTNHDFHIAVIGCWEDIKAEFYTEAKNDLLKKYRHDACRAHEDIDQLIFGFIAGRINTRETKREPRPSLGATSLVDLYRVAAEALGTTPEKLRDRYGHLNPGLQAMNLRNRINRQ